MREIYVLFQFFFLIIPGVRTLYVCFTYYNHPHCRSYINILNIIAKHKNNSILNKSGVIFAILENCLKVFWFFKTKQHWIRFSVSPGKVKRLQEYNYTMKYRQRKSHRNVSLSRRPCWPDCTRMEEKYPEQSISWTELQI